MKTCTRTRHEMVILGIYKGGTHYATTDHNEIHFSGLVNLLIGIISIRIIRTRHEQYLVAYSK